ncbi:tpr-repeat protein, putative [Leishmania tarentolae]|uniref:RNA polymerase II-associated protein 3 n=1 Tax=Leishmania tarentolae TaxID=5689 RepID=A0A640KJK3_LEITA|nr:tpr-repeat protein, putative [Leishmania tarentolae]GET93822.1 tpr-repeat protein, putative [Leishmania tarentolae]
MDRSVAEAIRQQSEDLRDELKELEQWEDAMQAKEMAKAQRKLPLPTISAAAEPPIRGTVPSLKEAIRQQQQQARAAGGGGNAAAEAIEDPIQQAKEKGNALFQSGHLQEAVAAYTVGIDLDPASATTHVLYANRAMCYLKLDQWTAAEKDATTCVHMNTGYAKAYYRRAVARKQLGKLREARADLEAVLALAPNDVSAQQEMESVTKAQQAKRAESSHTTTTATTRKKRIVIEEVDSEGDEGVTEAQATSAFKLSTEEEDLHQACIEEDMRRLEAVRRANEEQVRQEAQREAAAQAKRQRRHERVEIIEEEECSPTEEAKNAPLPTTSAPAVEPTPQLSTSSPPTSSSPSPTSATTRARVRRSIAKESLTTPKSFSEFERRFRDLAEQPDLRDYYVRQLSPATMAKLFGSNMSPEMLLGILQAIKTFDAATALQYAKGLCQVSRVEDMALFFNAREKAVVQDVLNLLRSAPDAPAQAIQHIERKLKPL